MIRSNSHRRSVARAALSTTVRRIAELLRINAWRRRARRALNDREAGYASSSVESSTPVARAALSTTVRRVTGEIRVDISKEVARAALSTTVRRART